MSWLEINQRQASDEGSAETRTTRQWLEGDYESGTWRASRAYMLDTLSNPGVRRVFETRKAWLDERFVDYVERELPYHTRSVKLEYVRDAVDRDDV